MFHFLTILKETMKYSHKSLFHFLMSLIEIMNYASKCLFHFLTSLIETMNDAYRDQVLLKDEMNRRIVVPDLKSCLR